MYNKLLIGTITITMKQMLIIIIGSYNLQSQKLHTQKFKFNLLSYSSNDSED